MNKNIVNFCYNGGCTTLHLSTTKVNKTTALRRYFILENSRKIKLHNCWKYSKI